MIDDYIRKVEGLLDRANHKETGEEEREACLAAADRIMKKHRLDRAMLFQAGKPPEREIVVKKYEAIKAEQFSTNLSYMRNAIFRHCGVMFRPGWREGTAVGYEEDIFFAEMLWSSVYMDFLTKMFPKWETWRDFDSNVYILKSAGYSWPEVRDMALPHKPSDRTGELTYKNAGSKLRTAFRRESVRLGVEVERQPQRPEKWRKGFAIGYDTSLRIRLRTMEINSMEEPGSPGEIAIMRDEDRVKAKFWEVFPEEHPDVQARKNKEWDEQQEAAEAAKTPAQKAADEKARERARKRMERSVSDLYDNDGFATGKKSAHEINLSRNATVGDPDRKEIS